MSEHTPGPWKWATSNSWYRLYADHGREKPQVLFPYVCGSDGHPDLEVSDADRRLIAAAPDLLEALKHSLAGHYATWMAARAEVEGGRVSHDLFQKEPEVIEAYDVIAKATGQGSGA